ncbi:MAG: hypothetical protein AB7G47_19720 [Mycolicibacterium sp.]|uniref:hypothetical protein n=1 Tax=Mycolicibacterium sp. TaxID=2320850 RepID=UPI003D0F221E
MTPTDTADASSTAVCRAKSQGGRRCDTHLKQLRPDQLLPPPRPERPTPSWAGRAGETPTQLYATEPAQIVNAALNTLLAALHHEPAMTDQLHAAVAGHPGAQLPGLRHRLKSPSSLARKIRTKAIERGLTPDQAAASLDDTIRYTVTTTRLGDLVPVLNAVVDRLTEQGWTVGSAEHSFLKGNPYKGIHLVLANNEGQRCEVQFHTEAALATKERGHIAYEAYRDLDIPAADRKRAYNRCVGLWDDVPTPPGLRKMKTIAGTTIVIKDYRPKPPPRQEDQR